MFARRQRWECCTKPSRRKDTPELALSEMHNDADWADFHDVESDDEYEKKERRFFRKLQNRGVSFRPLVQVRLVPARNERLKELFWRSEDYELSKQEAIREIRAYWRFSGMITRDALTVLYQPEYDWPEDFLASFMDEDDEPMEDHDQKLQELEREGVPEGCMSIAIVASVADTVFPRVDSLHCMQEEGDCCDSSIDGETDCDSMISSQQGASITKRHSFGISCDSESDDAMSVISDCMCVSPG
jgi:hypothetical protein